MSSTASASSKNNKVKSKALKPISRSSKAGLQFPVGRIACFLKAGKYAKRIGAGAPVYLAAVLEYMAAEVLELVSNKALDRKKSSIVPQHIGLAIRKDNELGKLLGHVTIPSYGGKNDLHQDPLPKSTGKKGQKD